MDNNKITEQLKQMAEMFKNAQTEREAFVLMPTLEGFAVHKISEELGKNILVAQALKEKAEEEGSHENSVLPIQHVSGSAYPDMLPTEPNIGMQKYMNIATKVENAFDKYKDDLLNANDVIS